jgi:flagellar hook-length control protein FliK
LSSSDFSLSKPASSTEPENYAAITNLKTQKSGEEGKPDVSIIQQSSSNGLSVLKNPPDLNADIGTGDGVFANLAGSAEMKQADEVIIKLEEAGTNILSDLRDKKIKLSNKGPDEAEKDKGKTAQTAISSTEQSKINSASDFVEFTDSPKNPNASVDSTEKIFNKELGISGSKNTIHKNDGSHTLVKDMSIGFTSASAVATGDAEQHVGEIRPQTVINQVIDTVQSAISKGYSRIRMEVNPASLGSLDMDLLVNQDRVKMIIFADNQEVRNLLQSNMDQLKTSLQQQGLRMEGVEVFVQDRSAGNGHNPNGNYYGQGFHGLEHPKGNNRNEKPRESEMSHGQLVSDRNRNATGLSIFV